MSSFLGWTGILLCLLDFLSIGLDCSCARRMSLRPASYLLILYPSLQLSMGSHLPLPKSAFLKSMVYTLLLTFLSALRILNNLVMVATTEAASDFYMSLISISLLVNSRCA